MPGGSGNENWKNSDRNTIWQPTKKVSVNCPQCAHKFELTHDEMKHLLKHLLIGELAEDYDAPIREMLYGALDKHGARAIGRELRRQISSTKSTTTVRQRAMEILSGLMKHYEKMHPPQLDLANMSMENLERELNRRLGIRQETATGEDAGDHPPAWMQKVVDDAEPVKPATGE